MTFSNNSFANNQAKSCLKKVFYRAQKLGKIPKIKNDSQNNKQSAMK